MKEEQSIEEGIVRIKLKVLVPSIFALLVATNTVTGLLFRQEENTEAIEYNDGKMSRKDSHLEEKMKDYVDDRFYELEIKELKEALKNKE